MDNKMLILITGVNKSSAEIHVINTIKNEYENGFFVLGDEQKLADKIMQVMELFESDHIIIDFREISKNAVEILRNRGIIKI